MAAPSGAPGQSGRAWAWGGCLWSWCCERRAVTPGSCGGDAGGIVTAQDGHLPVCQAWPCSSPRPGGAFARRLRTKTGTRAGPLKGGEQGLAQACAPSPASLSPGNGLSCPRRHSGGEGLRAGGRAAQSLRLEFSLLSSRRHARALCLKGKLKRYLSSPNESLSFQRKHRVGGGGGKSGIR